MAKQTVRMSPKQIATLLWKEWLRPLLPIVAIIIPLRSSIADYNPVPTGSMIPTILEGDLVFVNKAAYDLRVPFSRIRLSKWADPKRGDIVVCFSPEDHKRLVKRVIGTPGDKIEIRENRLYINSRPLEYTAMDPSIREIIPGEYKKYAVFAEEHLDGVIHPVMAVPAIKADKRNFGPVMVPENQYFLMGDNRDNSYDSRYFGFAVRDAIIGKATGIIASLDFKESFLPRTNRFFKAIH